MEKRFTFENVTFEEYKDSSGQKFLLFEDKSDVTFLVFRAKETKKLVFYIIDFTLRTEPERERTVSSLITSRTENLLLPSQEYFSDLAKDFTIAEILNNVFPSKHPELFMDVTYDRYDIEDNSLDKYKSMIESNRLL